MGSVKRTAEVVEEIVNGDAEALAARKAAKKAKKAVAAAAAAEAPAEMQVDEDEAAALAAKKAAKKAKKEAAAAAAAAADAEGEPEEDEAAARTARKAAKKAKKAAETVAAAAAEEEKEEEAPAPKKDKKSTTDATQEGEDEQASAPQKEQKASGDQEEPAPRKTHDNEHTVFVRGLPFATTEEALQKDFGECGEIVSLRMPLNDEGSCRGIAFIKYTSKEGMDKAVAFNETDYGGRTIYVSPAADKPEGKGKDGKGKSKGKDGKDGGKGRDENTVFVRGLPFATTEEALKKDFVECGEIVSLRMPLNDEGSCRGIAFIKFSNKDGMDKAMKFNETDYGGRTIFVSDAADKPEGKGKGKDGKDGKGKDGKSKGKGKKGKGKASSEAFAKNTGAMVESTGTKQTFDDSDDE